jgi:hypothetical protein
MKLNIPSNTEYLTWQDSINHYIDDMSQLTILETGIGKGSEFLVNKFKHVYSFESAWDREWYDLCTQQSSSNWNTMYYDLNRTDIYIDALTNFVDLKKIDIALVDHACKGDNHSDKCRRGDIAKYFMKIGIPNIFVHDYPGGNYFWDVSNSVVDEYGYDIQPNKYKTGYYKKR